MSQRQLGRSQPLCFIHSRLNRLSESCRIVRFSLEKEQMKYPPPTNCSDGLTQYYFTSYSNKFSLGGFFSKKQQIRHSGNSVAIISPDWFAMQTIPKQDTFNFFFLFSAAMMKLYHKECLQIRQQVIIFKQSLKTPLQMLLCFVSSDSSDQAHQIVGVFVVPYIAWRSCCFLLKSEEI